MFQTTISMFQQDSLGQLEVAQSLDLKFGFPNGYRNIEIIQQALLRSMVIAQCLNFEIGILVSYSKMAICTSRLFYQASLGSMAVILRPNLDIKTQFCYPNDFKYIEIILESLSRINDKKFSFILQMAICISRSFQPALLGFMIVALSPNIDIKTQFCYPNNFMYIEIVLVSLARINGSCLESKS